MENIESVGRSVAKMLSREHLGFARVRRVSSPLSLTTTAIRLGLSGPMAVERLGLAAAQRQRLVGMQLVPIIAIRIGAVESISGPVAAEVVKRVLAETVGMTAEAEVLAAEPGAAAEAALMPHAAKMRAAAKARMSTAEAATAKAAVAATSTSSTVRVGRADGERRGERCCCQNYDGSFHGKLLSC
jgi:hypothetical protein